MSVFTILWIISGALSLPVIFILIQSMRGRRSFQAPLALVIPGTCAFLFAAATYLYFQVFQDLVFKASPGFSAAPDEVIALVHHLILKIYKTQAGLFILLCIAFLLRKRIPALAQKPTHAGRVFTFLTLGLFLYLQHQHAPGLTARLEPALHALAFDAIIFLQHWFYCTFAATFLTSLVFLIQPKKEEKQ